MEKLTLYTKDMCPLCVQAKKYLDKHNISYDVINVEEDVGAFNFIKNEGHTTVPQIYHNGELFIEGGWTGLKAYELENIKNLIESEK